jgi:hypothetical protein
MKAVQVGILAGILVALLVCAGLLFKIYRGQQAPPPPPVAAAPATPPVAAPVAESPAPPAPVPAAESQPTPEVAKPAVPRRKPSPTRAPKEQAAELVAENQPPAEPTPTEPAPDTPAPTPPPPPPQPAEQTTQPEPPPPPVLNPPSGTETAPPPPRTPHTLTIPASTALAVRLNETLSSDKNHPGDAFSATLDQPLVIDGFVIAERGARLQGKVLEAERAGHAKGGSSLSVHLTGLHTSDGQDVAIETERYHKEGPSAASNDVKKVGAGAIIGAAIGAMAGGGKGAAIGAGVGAAAGGGAAAATRGKPVELPVETRLTFHLAQPVTLTERLN